MKYNNEKQAMDDLITELSSYMIGYNDFDSLEMAEAIAEQYNIDNSVLHKATEQCESQ